MERTHSKLFRFILKILLVEFIVAILVGLMGGFGNGRSAVDYSNGLWITGAAEMGLGFLFWLGGIDQRNVDGSPINYMAFGVEEGTKIFLQERENVYSNMNFWFVAGLLPFSIGTIIALFVR